MDSLRPAGIFSLEIVRSAFLDSKGQSACKKFNWSSVTPTSLDCLNKLWSSQARCALQNLCITLRLIGVG